MICLPVLLFGITSTVKLTCKLYACLVSYIPCLALLSHLMTCCPVLSQGLPQENLELKERLAAREELVLKLQREIQELLSDKEGLGESVSHLG